MTAVRRASDAETRAVTAAWHAPACSVCHRPIETIERALATWVDDGDGTHMPMVVHVGRCWSALDQHARADNHYVMSLHVDSLRRSPMEAVIIAMRRRASCEAERLVWHQWVSIVLGLPFGDERTLWPSGKPADYVPDQVITLAAAMSVTGETCTDTTKETST